MLKKSNPEIRGNLELSYTDASFWYKRTLAINSGGWKRKREKIIKRDDSKCRFCSIKLSKYIVVDHINGDATDNRDENLGLNCKACDTIRHCGLSSAKSELVAYSSSLSQIEIVNRSHHFFIENQRNPSPIEVDSKVGNIKFSPYQVAYVRFNSENQKEIRQLENVKGFFTNEMNFNYLLFSDQYYKKNDLINAKQNLNKNQKTAAFSEKRLTCVIAGPGCGKTKTLISRIVHLMNDKDIEGQNILVLTFSVRAIKEIRDRLTLLNVEKKRLPLIFNIHSFCYWFLRENLNPFFLIFDGNDQKALIKKILKEDLDLASFSDSKYVRKIISKISLIKISGARDRDGNYDLLKLEENERKVFNLYQIYLEKNNFLDFNDVLTKTLEALENSEKLRETQQKKFPHILVDEFQDINNIQWSIVKMLAGEKNNLFLVGDPNQSIYGFQGSSPELIFSMQNNKIWTNFFLNKNYRSTPQIVEISNRFLSLNEETMVQNLLEPVKNSGERVVILLNKGVWDVIREIINLRETKKLNFKDFAIIYRNNFLSSWIEKELVKNRIPYEILNSFKFIEREEIRDVLAYLKSVIYKDDLSIIRIISMVTSVGSKTVEKIITEASNFEENSIFNYLKKLFWESDFSEHQQQPKWLKPKQREIIEKFFLDLQSLIIQSEKGGNVSDFLQQILNKFDYFSYLIDKGNEAEERLLNVKQLMNMIIEWERKYDLSKELKLTSAEFINYISLSFSEADSDKKLDNLIISTVHQVKGLEFKVVFFVNLDEKIIPSEKSSSLSEKREEERIFYVGMTRAKDFLYLVNNSHWPSKFINILLGRK